MSIKSWVGTVQTDEGPTVTMTVFGLGGHTPDGVDILPSRYGFVRYARVSHETLRGQWQRMGAPEAKELLSAWLEAQFAVHTPGISAQSAAPSSAVIGG